MNTTQPTGTVYLSGAISADPDYKAKFKRYEAEAKASGARLVLNPAIFPPGWEYDAYMEHCLIMVRRCDTMLMLPDWRQSPGACAEHAYAVSLKKHIVYA